MMRLCVVLLFLAFTAVYAYPIENSYQTLLQQVNELQRTVAKLEKSVEQNSLMARNKRADVSPPVGISFSAILDDVLNNIVIGQTIVFDKAYINDGDAYDTNTGVFTVPIDGVYLLSYFVGEYGQDQALLRLLVNGQNKVDVVAEGIQVEHNDQGGNLVI
ncbi:EMILIN-1-like isoform X1 [Ruditapes philippinarum]|uniref:EMILIN-1-like isoform X1 n=1 Tax=Ruditapes philippinarum TaxID=129788 RepID=UPI00295A6CA0|nr:EMILIN-1-like isoform X1 [Ruditapes philippinarum]